MLEHPVDLAHLEELRLVLEDDYEVLLQTFIEDSKVRYAEAERSLRKGDSRALREAAHSLKGASANTGAGGLAELCRVVEDGARSRSIEGLAPVLEQISAELERVRVVLARELDALRHAS